MQIKPKNETKIKKIKRAFSVFQATFSVGWQSRATESFSWRLVLGRERERGFYKHCVPGLCSSEAFVTVPSFVF